MAGAAANRDSIGRDMAKRTEGDNPAIGGGKVADKSDKQLSPATISKILTTATPGELHRSAVQVARYNPRQIPDSAFRRLCTSIRKFGLVQRPLVNTRTGNTIVGGHQRIRAADHVFGTEDYTLPVDLIDVDETTERALNIALNNPELQGQYDIDLLGEVMASINESGGDIRDTGFSLTDLKTFMTDEFIATVFGDGGDSGGGGGRENSEATQAAAESPHVELLAEIRDAGKEANDVATSSAGIHAPTGVDSGGSAAVGLDGGDNLSVGQPPVRQQQQQPSIREDLAAKRDRFKTTTQSPTADSADTIVTLVFERSDMVPRFLRDIGFDSGERFVDGVEVARAIGLEGW